MEPLDVGRVKILGYVRKMIGSGDGSRDRMDIEIKIGIAAYKQAGRADDAPGRAREEVSMRRESRL